MCFRTPPCYRTKSATCICAVVVLHIVLIITLVAALFTRFYVYRSYEIGSMPSDTRLLLKSGSSIFCVSHLAKSYIMDEASSQRIRNSHEINSNTLPEFDLYTLEQDPRSHQMPRDRMQYKLEGFSSLVSKGYDYNHFRFLNGSVMNIKMCSEEVYESGKAHKFNGTGLTVFIVEGNIAFKTFTTKLERGSINCTTSAKDCPLHFNVSPTAQSTCENPTEQTQYTNYVKNASNTGEYYVIIYNPNTKTEGQKYRIYYDLDRYEYDLRNHTAQATRTRSVEANPDLYLLLKFKYTRNSTYDKLYNIVVEYTCQPNNMVYIAIFFFAPLAFVILFVVGLMCCFERYGDRSQRFGAPLMSQGQDREGPDRLSSYGSTEPIYT